MAPIRNPRHRVRAARARRAPRPRLAIVLAGGLVAAAIPALALAIRTPERAAPAAGTEVAAQTTGTEAAQAATPAITLQAREVAFWTGEDGEDGDVDAPPVHADGAPVELGTRFTAAENGWVTGVRFYKAPGERGRHTGSLWSARGERLATVTFTGESRSGWQEARFGTPVPVVAGRVYTISYHSAHGTYAGRPSAGPLRTGPLSTTARRTGVYAYGGSRFPREWNPEDYTYYVGPIYRWLERHRPRPHGPTPSMSGPVETPVASISATASPTVSPSGGGTVSVTPSPPLVTSPSPAQSTGPSTGPSASSSAVPSGGSSVDPSAGPTRVPASASASASATPVRPGGGGRVCPGGYPTPACTGAPPVAERAMAANDGGAYKVTTPGAVLDGVHIGGDLLIAADRVVIKNSRIDGSVINEVGTRHYSFAISDSTVGPAGGCNEMPAVGESHYTADRVHVRNHSDGFRVSGDDVSIRDSYVHLCSRPGDHSDGIQTYVAGRGLVFHHNTVDQRDARDITAPIFITDPRTADLTLTDNLVMGGTYSIQVKNVRGSVVVRDNRLVDKSWVYGPVEADCGRIDWSGNTLVAIDADYRVTRTVGPLPCHT